MVFKIFMCVLVFLSWSTNCYGYKTTSKLPPTPANVTVRQTGKSCGGWGKKVTNMAEYRKMKHTCYLVIRNEELCCIDLPDCPKGLQPEIPLKPYHLFPIKKLSLGCVKPENEKKKTRKPKVKVTVCFAETKNKMDGNGK